VDKRELEKKKHRLVVVPFYLFLGAISWGLITNTPLIGLLGRTLSALAIAYFLYHLHQFYFKDKFKAREHSDNAESNEDS